MTRGETVSTLIELEEQRQKRQDVLERILDLLEKAEDRSADEPENETKWRRVLNNLWKSFDEAKARLGETETLIEQESRKATQPTPAPLPPPESRSSTEAPAPSPKPAVRASAIVYRTGATASTGGKSVQDRRRQILYRCAIDKVKDRRIAWMTIDELDLAIEFFGVLSQRRSAGSDDAKLAAFLEKAQINVDEVCAEMRRHRAQLYAKKSR